MSVLYEGADTGWMPPGFALTRASSRPWPFGPASRRQRSTAEDSAIRLSRKKNHSMTAWILCTGAGLVGEPTRSEIGRRHAERLNQRDEPECRAQTARLDNQCR